VERHEFDAALKTIAGTDPKAISAAYRKAHERSRRQPSWLNIVHDLNLAPMSPKVKGFVSPQSWFVDLTLGQRAIRQSHEIREDASCVFQGHLSHWERSARSAG